MLNENIRIIRKSMGLSQEELAARLNVVRQTISKWEQGLSVPDADLLIALSAALDTPVSTLLGETVAAQPNPDDLQALSQKLELINAQLAQRKTTKRKALLWLLISLCAALMLLSAALILLHSPYLSWNYSALETAVIGIAFHALEWLFVRTAPIALIGALIGIYLIWKKR